MRLMFLALMCVAGCSAGGSGAYGDGYEVGRQPEFFSTSYLWQAGDANRVVVVNDEAHTIESFTAEPFAHELSLPLPLRNPQQAVVAAGNGAYFVAIADDEYAIVQRNGAVHRNPAEVVGRIASVAYAPEAHVLVFSDSFHALTMLSLSAEGAVLGSYKTGGLTESGATLGAGAILRDGQLVVATGDKELRVLDVLESIASQTVVARDFVFGDAVKLEWLAASSQNPQIILAHDVAEAGTRILALDAVSGQVVDQRAVVPADVQGRFRDYDPHFILQTATQRVQGVVEVVSLGADGKLRTDRLRGAAAGVQSTLFDAVSQKLSVTYDPNVVPKAYPSEREPQRPLEVYRFLLGSGGAPESRTEVTMPTAGRLVLTPEFLFVAHKSMLGRFDRRGYGREGTTERVEGYNLDLLQDRR